MPKRVLYVIPSWFTLDHQLNGQPSFLKEQGFDVEVLCEYDKRAAQAARREGVRLHFCNIESSVKLLKDLVAFYRIMRLIKRGNYDIVNSSTKKGGFLVGLAGRLAGVSHILYVVMGISKDRTGWLKGTAFPLIEKIICAMAHHVIFISESNMELFLTKRICPRNKAVMLGRGSANGIDTKRFQRTDQTIPLGYALREALCIPRDAYVMGFVGRLVREKGVRELSEAWKSVRADHDGVHLLFLGPVEVDPGLADCLKILRNDSQVHFAGFLPDPVAGYSAMDCLVLPSYQEGFGGVILEAGAMELPVVASRVVGCVDAVVHEQTGLLVEPKNSLALAEAMERVLTDTERARQWGQNGRKRCVELFQQERLWQQIADFYEELISDETVLKSKRPSNELD